ncbi:MAG TPA: conjugal transfer protein TraF [Vicinamibacterales bacterium]|nr:conjugal transfer protein TraF [Vicinamibacterales bacterium]
MKTPVSHFLTTISALLTLGIQPAAAQPFEAAGLRALGMGGAFVAVANDSSATWWNPAGLATGPFLDIALARASGESGDALPASRTGLWSFSLGTPPLGVSYYRLRITDIRAASPTAPAEAGREDRAAGVGIRSLSVSQFGATVLHTITTGVSAGATVKYLRGAAHVRDLGATDSAGAISDLLDEGDDLSEGDAEGTVDLDVGVLAAMGAVRVGVTARNLREPSFGGRRLERQVRAGAAFDGEAAGRLPLTASLDVDLRRYAAATGDRRVVAVGGEHWVRPRRVAIRGGARFNTVGEKDRTVTAGASVAVRAALFVDGYGAVGTKTGESGWGVAARVSF